MVTRQGLSPPPSGFQSILLRAEPNWKPESKAGWGGVIDVSIGVEFLEDGVGWERVDQE